jgi:hypothetical protein
MYDQGINYEISKSIQKPIQLFVTLKFLMDQTCFRFGTFQNFDYWYILKVLDGFPFILHFCKLETSLDVGFSFVFFGQCFSCFFKGVLDLIITELFAVKCLLTTSINNAHIKWKNSKTTNTPETISSTIFGSAAILQTLGVNYELQWTLHHYDLVIGKCSLASFKTVQVKPAF